MSMLTSFKDFEPSDEFTKKIEAAVETEEKVEPRFKLTTIEGDEGIAFLEKNEKADDAFVIAEKYEKSDDVLANTLIPDTVREIVLFKKEIKKPGPTIRNDLPDNYDYNEGKTYSKIKCSYPLGRNLVTRKISLQVCALHKDDMVCIDIECERALERQRMFRKKDIVKVKKVEKVEKAQVLFQAKINPIQEDS